jgi:hypothetical protein
MKDFFLLLYSKLLCNRVHNYAQASIPAMVFELMELKKEKYLSDNKMLI